MCLSFRVMVSARHGLDHGVVADGRALAVVAPGQQQAQGQEEQDGEQAVRHPVVHSDGLHELEQAFVGLLDHDQQGAGDAGDGGGQAKGAGLGIEGGCRHGVNLLPREAVRPWPPC